MPTYKDCFDHEHFADALLKSLEAMPAGSLIGIQGGWGRGKTDVLSRLRDKAEASQAIAAQAWMDPWRCPTDAMLPLVKLFSQAFRNTEEKAEASEVCQWLVGSSAGPAGYIRVELVKRLFGVESRKEGVFDSQDCLARFHRLTNKLTGTSRLLVCVDDLDRCPPAQQVPLLESLFFLTEDGSGEKQGPLFVLAYNLEVLSAAVRVHYGDLGKLEVENYLDKIFDLRVSLPPISESRQEGRFLELCKETDLLHEARMLSAFFDTARDTRNPRLLDRAFAKYRYAGRAFDMEADASPDRFCLVAWLILSEAWPELRLQFQSLAKEKCPAGDSPFLRLLIDAHTIISHGGEKSDRNLFLARLYQVINDSAVNAGNIFIQVLARLNSGGKRRFLKDGLPQDSAQGSERASSLKTFVNLLSTEFQHCDSALRKAGL